MKERTVKYKSKDIEVLWKPDLCVHSRICIEGLPEVFNNKIQKWINPNNAPTVRVIAQVKACPSGALSYNVINENYIDKIETKNKFEDSNSNNKSPVIVNLEKGMPYIWCTCDKSSSQPWCDGSHFDTEFSPHIFNAEKSGPAAICTCKKTKNKPYCDGSHS